MRKFVIAAIAVIGLAGPAFAQNLTLPTGAYSQAEAPTVSGDEAGASSFDALVDHAPARPATRPVRRHSHTER